METFEGDVMLTKKLHIAGMTHRFILSVMLVCGSVPLFAANDHQHSHDSGFSDPAVFTKVPDGWAERGCRYCRVCGFLRHRSRVRDTATGAGSGRRTG